MAYVFDFGDDWTHLCTVGPERADPVKAYGMVPTRPAAIFGWGDLPDQYGRRWIGDDGESGVRPTPQAVTCRRSCPGGSAGAPERFKPVNPLFHRLRGG